MVLCNHYNYQLSKRIKLNLPPKSRQTHNLLPQMEMQILSPRQVRLLWTRVKAMMKLNISRKSRNQRDGYDLFQSVWKFFRRDDLKNYLMKKLFLWQFKRKYHYML